MDREWFRTPKIFHMASDKPNIQLHLVAEPEKGNIFVEDIEISPNASVTEIVDAVNSGFLKFHCQAR